jgi:hypothetical protein
VKIKNTEKMNLIPVLKKHFTIGSYGVGIGRAWHSRKAYETHSLLMNPKEKLKKNYFSSHKLLKHKSTSFLVSRNFRD